jgi:hypothetical protein
MSGSGQPGETADDGVIADATKPACVALVPVVPSVQWSRLPDLASPDSTFITHLIATAERVPQTRTLRRATPADAQAAYRGLPRDLRGAGIRTRQII